MTIGQRCYALIGEQQLSRRKATRLALFLATGILIIADRGFAQLTVDRASGALTFQLAESAEVKGYTISSANGLLNPEAWNSLEDQGADGWIEANPVNEYLSELNPFGSIDPSASPLNLGNGYVGTTVPPSSEDLAVQYVMSDGSVADGEVEYVGPINDFVLRVDPESGAASLEALSANVGSFDVSGYTISSPSGSLNVEGFNGISGDAWSRVGLTTNTLSQISFDSSQLFDNSVVDIGVVFTPGAEQDLELEYGVVGDTRPLVGTVTYGGGDGGDGGPPPTSCEAIAAARVPGDTNGDDTVDFTDFLALSANFGQAGGYEAGDIDCSGEVDFADFLTLSANFGATANAAAAVPEPSTGLLAIFAVPLLTSICRKRAAGSTLCLCLVAMTLLVSVGTDSATALDFNTRIVVLDPDNPGSDAQINTATEARNILRADFSQPQPWNVLEDESGTVDFIDFAGGPGAFANFDYPYPNGVNDESQNDFTVQVTGFLEIPEGTYFIGLNSDDGGYISMPRVSFTNTVNENGATGVPGELFYNGTRGQGTFTYAEFTVPAGGIRTEFEAVMFERGGGDAFEVAVLDDEFPIESNADWAAFAIELGDGSYDWKLIEDGPGAGDFNWDGEVDFADFTVMAANFNTGSSFAQGDFNGDGTVDLADFGEFFPLLTPPAVAASSVPEPATSFPLFAMGLVTVLSMRRRTGSGGRSNG